MGDGKCQKSAATPSAGPAAKRKRKDSLIDFYARSLQSSGALKKGFLLADSYAKVRLREFERCRMCDGHEHRTGRPSISTSVGFTAL